MCRAPARVGRQARGRSGGPASAGSSASGNARHAQRIFCGPRTLRLDDTGKCPVISGAPAFPCRIRVLFNCSKNENNGMILTF
jgi:hypothetical protein